MTTFNDWIEKVWRRVNSGSVEATVQLLSNITSTATDIFVTPATSNAMRIGARLAVGTEVMYVTNWVSGTGETTVVRGYEGSTAQAHSASDIVYVQPRYTRFDIGVALNDELARLTSPDNGLFQVKTQTITFNPVYMGYDLGPEIADSFIDIMEVRYKIPFPSRNYPAIHSWKVLRSIGDTSTFPSGAGIVFYEGGYPGQPVYVQYSAPFTTSDLVTDTDTDVRTVTGMTSTMLDIPPLGAEIQLTLPREIRRNFMDVQPDPRKAPEIPPLAVSNSVQALTILYNQRVAEEAARLSRQYTRVEAY